MLTALFLLALQAPVADFQRYSIDASRSTVGFDGESTLHDFTGKTHAITGELRCDLRDPALFCGGAVWVEARTLDTGNGSRDSDMRDTLDVKRHPWILFQVERVDGRLENGRGELVAHGRFTIRGIERARDMSMRVEPLSNGALHVVGESNIRLSDHKVDPPSVLFVSVKDKMRLWIDVVVVPKADERAQGLVQELEIARDGGKPARERIAVLDGSVAWASASERAYFAAGPQGARVVSSASGETRASEPCDPAPKGEWTRASLDRGFALSCAGVEWLRVEGTSGDRACAGVLAGLDGVPDEVRRALLELRGAPRSITVRSHTSAGEHARSIRFLDAQPASLPRWIVDPSAWTAPPEGALAPKKG